jgi:hypothetical protein
MDPTGWDKDQLTLLLCFPVAENCTGFPVVTVTEEGETWRFPEPDVVELLAEVGLDPLPETREIVALALFVESTVLVAVRITVCGAAIALGAV